MKGWFNKALRRVQAGETIDAVTAEFRDALPDDALESGYAGGGDGDNETHVHLHLPGGGRSGAGGGARTPDDGEEEMHGTGSGLSDEAFSQLVQRVDQMEQTLQQIMGMEEEEVELEGDNGDGTRDARRFTMRRGKKLTRDEEVPERKPEMIGETDLPGVEDLTKRTGDSVSQEALWQQTVAAAEILIPGLRVPTFDAKHSPLLTAKRLCAFRRHVVETVFDEAAVKPVIRSFVGDGVTGRAALKRLPCETIKACFNLSAEAMKVHNNSGTTRANAATGDGGNTRPTVITNAEINRMNREHWAKNSNGAAR